MAGTEVDPALLSETALASLGNWTKQTLQARSGHSPREDGKLFNAVVIGSFPSAVVVSLQLAPLISQQLALDRMFFFHPHLSGRKLRPTEDLARLRRDVAELGFEQRL